MHYTLLFYQDAAAFSARSDPERHKEFYGSFGPYMKALHAAGVVVTGAGLQPPESATTVRTGGAKPLVQDGPYADTKEQLGGFFIIDVPNLDAALEWAARCPIQTVEVRPNLPPVKP